MNSSLSSRCLRCPELESGDSFSQSGGLCRIEDKRINCLHSLVHHSTATGSCNLCLMRSIMHITSLDLYGALRLTYRIAIARNSQMEARDNVTAMRAPDLARYVVWHSQGQDGAGYSLPYNT